MLLGCALRRRELVDLTLDHIQRREDHWVFDAFVVEASFWGPKITEKVVWCVVKECGGRLGVSKLAPTRSQTVVRSVQSRFRRRVGSDSISLRSRFGTDGREISGLTNNGSATPLMPGSASNPARNPEATNAYRNTSAPRLISAIFSGSKPARSASFSQPSRMRIEKTRSKSEYRNW